MRFLPAEIFVIKIIVTLCALDAALLAYKGIGFHFIGYASSAGIGLFAMAIGQLYRTVRQDEGISLATTSAGLFILFSLAGSVFNYCLLPIQFPRIDNQLAQLDMLVGFHWPSIATWASQHPFFGQVLKIVYFSSLAQLVLVILILGFTKRAQQLHLFLITGVLGALLTFAVWCFFPSFGATAVYSLPDDILARMPIAVPPAYGEELIRLSLEGATYISPDNVLGLIGFPSFHTVMALMSVVFMRHYKFVWPAFLIVNAIMIPAILIQGGHHLSDMVGGIVIFTIAYKMAQIVMRRLAGTVAHSTQMQATNTAITH
jgi:PAP2 superfamily